MTDTPRNDEHRPSLLDPAEYVFTAAFYQGDSPWMARAYQDEMVAYDEAVEQFEIFDGNWSLKGTCDHCGAAFNHGVLFYHLPSTELIHVGHICAANTVGLPDKAAKARKDAEKKAAEMKERDERKQAGAEWRSENADLVTLLEALPEDANYFLKDLARSLEQWGKLTDRQADAARRSIERDAKFEATKAERAKALENAPALTAGRQTLTGTILKTKVQDGYYGASFKMLVELDDGNRVWGTVPSAIDRNDLTGCKVNFTATVKPKPDDPHFGYFSRPASAKVLS